jgi:hypothetical protein
MQTRQIGLLTTLLRAPRSAMPRERNIFSGPFDRPRQYAWVPGRVPCMAAVTNLGGTHCVWARWPPACNPLEGFRAIYRFTSKTVRCAAPAWVRPGLIAAEATRVMHASGLLTCPRRVVALPVGGMSWRGIVPHTLRCCRGSRRSRYSVPLRVRVADVASWSERAEAIEGLRVRSALTLVASHATSSRFRAAPRSAPRCSIPR